MLFYFFFFFHHVEIHVKKILFYFLNIFLKKILKYPFTIKKFYQKLTNQTNVFRQIFSQNFTNQTLNFKYPFNSNYYISKYSIQKDQSNERLAANLMEDLVVDECHLQED